MVGFFFLVLFLSCLVGCFFLVFLLGYFRSEKSACAAMPGFCAGDLASGKLRSRLCLGRRHTLCDKTTAACV